MLRPTDGHDPKWAVLDPLYDRLLDTTESLLAVRRRMHEAMEQVGSAAVAAECGGGILIETNDAGLHGVGGRPWNDGRVFGVGDADSDGDCCFAVPCSSLFHRGICVVGCCGSRGARVDDSQQWGRSHGSDAMVQRRDCVASSARCQGTFRSRWVAKPGRTTECPIFDMGDGGC